MGLFVLLLSLVTSLGIADNNEHVNPYAADCFPKEPLVASGSTLELNCTLKQVTAEITAQEMICKFGSEPLTLIILDNSTVNIRKENMTRYMSQGNIFCFINVSGRLEKSAQVVIRVADFPVAPNITECIVYNWSRMVCRWEPETQDTGLPTNQMLGWTLLKSMGLRSCLNPVGIAACEWNTTSREDTLKIGMMYEMVMSAMNELGKALSIHKHFDTNTLVKPDPVINLNIGDVTSRSLRVTWDWIYPDSEKELFYRITYKSIWNDKNMTEETRDKYHLLLGLIPYTDYTISVDCIPILDGKRRGFWSDPVFLKTRTMEDVPARAPEITAGGYHVSHIGTERRVEIFWKPVPKRWLQGELTEYRIKCFDYWNRSLELRKEQPEPSRIYSYKLTELEKLVGVNYVTVEAKTIKGYNDSLKLDTLIVPQDDIAPPKPDIFYAVGKESEIIVSWSAVINATGYTIFWCKQTMYRRCKNAVDWMSVFAIVTNWTIPIGAASYQEFLVAISVEMFLPVLQNTVSSGMMWADCIPDVSKSVKAPSALVFSMDQQAYALTVEWTKPDCHESSYVVSYELLYCQWQSCNGKGCCVNNKTKIVRNNETKTVIEELLFDYEYQVEIRSISLTGGVSENSKAIKRVVHGSGFSGGAIAGIVIASFFMLILLTMGLVTIAELRNRNFLQDRFSSVIWRYNSIVQHSSY